MPGSGNNIQNIRETKKFVFQVFDENIDFIEPMASEQKNALINRLLYNHRIDIAQEKKKTELRNLVKKIAITVIAILIGVPLLITLVNLSFDATFKGYSQMQSNFEIFFKD